MVNVSINVSVTHIFFKAHPRQPQNVITLYQCVLQCFIFIVHIWGSAPIVKSFDENAEFNVYYLTRKLFQLPRRCTGLTLTGVDVDVAMVMSGTWKVMKSGQLKGV